MDLSKNLLVNLEDQILANALNLETLDLSKNKLKSISLESNNNFRRLSTLNMAYNSLRAMDESWRMGYPKLRMLNISHNRIGPVIWGTDLQYVKTYHGMFLDLSFNKIQRVEIDTKSDSFQSIYLDLVGR